jgi:hypothetical protein
MSEQWMELYCKACNKNALSQVIRVLEEGQQNVKVVLLQFLTTDLFSVLLCALNLPFFHNFFSFVRNYLLHTIFISTPICRFLCKYYGLVFT